jgi:chemotaxis response regulator CheB
MVSGGLRLLLDAEEDFQVVAEAGDVETALHRVEAHRPRIVVLDLNMPGSPTLPALPRFLAAAPGMSVVVNDDGFFRTSVQATSTRRGRTSTSRRRTCSTHAPTCRVRWRRCLNAPWPSRQMTGRPRPVSWRATRRRQ